jgi:hypothetical protein
MTDTLRLPADRPQTTGGRNYIRGGSV